MVDVVGPLPPSQGYKYLLTAICRTSRFVQAVPMTEATSTAAASAFLQGWVSLMGVPSVVTSDNGGSFVAGIWKEMMSRLNIEVKYSALYRPQAIGILERQHRSIKDSLKAAIVDMGEAHQDKWMDFLPFVLLGRRVAYQPDLGASPSELTFGQTVKIPGQILRDPGEPLNEDQVQQLLKNIKISTTGKARQTSRHNPPEKPLPDIPDNVTHVYTRQHHTKGLQAPYEGPFKIESRVSRSTVRLEVGVYQDGTKRYEIRHMNDLKLAHPDSLAAEAKRPKLGRPSIQADDQVATEVPEPTSAGYSNQFPDPPIHSTGRVDENKQVRQPEIITPEGAKIQTEENAITGPPPNHPFPSRPSRSTRNPNPKYVDAIWSASPEELGEINRAIGN